MSAANAKSYVLLQIGNRRFALPSTEVSELAPPVRLHQFPHNSPLVSGIIVRRGRLVPVYDVCPLLTGKNSPSHQFYLVAQRHFGSAKRPRRYSSKRRFRARNSRCSTSN